MQGRKRCRELKKLLFTTATRSSISLRMLSLIFKSTRRSCFPLTRPILLKQHKPSPGWTTAAMSSFWGNRLSSIWSGISITAFKMSLCSYSISTSSIVTHGTVFGCSSDAWSTVLSYHCWWATKQHAPSCHLTQMPLKYYAPMEWAWNEVTLRAKSADCRCPSSVSIEDFQHFCANSYMW